MTNEHALSQSDCTAEFPTKKIYPSKHSRETSPVATAHREDFASLGKETYSTDTTEMEQEQENIAKNNSPLPGDTPALEKFITNVLPPVLVESFLIKPQSSSAENNFTIQIAQSSVTSLTPPFLDPAETFVKDKSVQGETEALYALPKLPVASLSPRTPEPMDQENAWTNDVKPLAEGGASEIVCLFT